MLFPTNFYKIYPPWLFDLTFAAIKGREGARAAPGRARGGMHSGVQGLGRLQHALGSPRPSSAPPCQRHNHFLLFLLLQWLFCGGDVAPEQLEGGTGCPLGFGRDFQENRAALPAAA